jgi:hypothetical protein
MMLVQLATNGMYECYRGNDRPVATSAQPGQIGCDDATLR